MAAAAIIDAHQHFWRYSPEEYGWIGERDTALRRDFLPDDLRAEMRAAGVDGCVAVQARGTVAETEWLLTLARENLFIVGVVGWAPLLEGDGARPALERLAAEPGLRGVRVGAQGEPPGFLLRDDLNAGVGLLRGLGRAFDILIYERQLPDAIGLVDRHPEQVFVLDHLAKPRARDGVTEPWATRLRDLARRPNVYCKVSGLVTEADREAWTEAGLRPYLETALAAFGPDRLMFGSDWPVCLLASSYGRWAEIVRRFAAPLTPSERDSLFGGAAKRAYGLP
jgi:L-fuconolactonase